MSFKNMSEAIHFLTVQRYPDYLKTANPSYWEECNRQVVRFSMGVDNDLNGAEQDNVLDVFRCGEPKHLDMFKS